MKAKTNPVTGAHGPAPKKSHVGVKLVPFLATLMLACGLWMVPCPQGLSLQAWHLFAIFVSTIFAIIVKPLPLGAVAVSSLGACLMTHTLTTKQALSGFSSDVVWLVLFAFLIARGVIKTGLGHRIAYIFVRFFGKSALGLAYSLVGADLMLSPAIPSVTARGAGIVFPIVKALAESQGSTPADKTERKVGAYLMQTAFQGSVITCAMFMTAFAGNPSIVRFAEQLGITITWGSWAAAAIVPGLVSLILLPLVLYVFYKPEVTQTPEAPALAKEKLAHMGKLSRGEKVMMLTFVGLLVLWIFGNTTLGLPSFGSAIFLGTTGMGVGAADAALFGLVLLLLTGVLDWEEILQEKGAWDTFMWFAILLMMAGMLNELGLISWFSAKMQSWVGHLHWGWAFGILSLVYFFVHYFFASTSAHVASMYSAFLAVLLACGAPAMLSALALAFLSTLCGGLTHYSVGTAPVYFGAGYVTITDWWRLGAIVAVANLIIWGIVGGLWWQVLGIW